MPWQARPYASSADILPSATTTRAGAGASLSERQRAICAFAEQLTLRPVENTEADLEALRAAGLSDHDAWDVIEVAAMYNFTNRLALATGQIPNPEYHALARG